MSIDELTDNLCQQIAALHKSRSDVEYTGGYMMMTQYQWLRLVWVAELIQSKKREVTT